MERGEGGGGGERGGGEGERKLIHDNKVSSIPTRILSNSSFIHSKVANISTTVFSN